ncbi:MAG: hypothetical protein MUF38_12335 [Anaerolineae bacterium]|jgi:hypothetical protein|nr:hypothetical protein [Anaerolineae bacterium]
MTWQNIRDTHPNRWVLVEAIDAYTEKGQRITPTLIVVGEYDDYYTGMEVFKHLHAEDIWREYYVLHTSRQTPNIGVLDAFQRVVHV